MSMCDVPVEHLSRQTYEDLLRHWRFQELGDPCFQSDMGRWGYYKRAMAEAKVAMDTFAPGAASGVSKKLGCDN